MPGALKQSFKSSRVPIIVTQTQSVSANLQCISVCAFGDVLFFKNSDILYVLVYQCILVTLSRRLHSSSLINITSDTTSTFLINNLRPQNRRQTGLRCGAADSLRVLNRFHIRKAEQFLQGQFFCARRSDLCYNKEQRWSAGNTKKTLAEGS